MERKCYPVLILFLGLSLPAVSLAQERVRFGTATKAHPVYVLPVMAALEQSFFKEQRLEVEFFPFDSGSAMYRAVSAGALEVGMVGFPGHVQGVAGGVPTVVVADLKQDYPFYLWVRPDSPIKGRADLKGTKFGTSRLGGDSHVYGRLVAKALGIEKDVRFVATGGLTLTVAALKTGAIDVAVLTIFAMAPLYLRGEARQLLAVREFLPQDWLDLSIFSRREVSTRNPQAVTGTIRAIFKATGFIRRDRDWSLARIMSHFRYSPEVAQFSYDLLRYGKDGRISRKGVENVRDFLIQYGIVPKEKAPAVDDLFTNEFLPAA